MKKKKLKLTWNIVDSKKVNLAEKYNLPSQAKDNHNLSEFSPPAGHYRYIYHWTNLTSGMWYIGKRPKPLGDRYDHSSKDENFLDDFCNPNIKWKYEIMKYVETTDDDLSDIEYEILSSMHDPKTGKGGAARNLMSYNRSNGIPSTKIVKPIDREKVERLAEEILNNSETNTFPISNYKTKELIRMIRAEERIQSRAVDNPAAIKNIKYKIEKEGSNKNCSPVIMLEGVITQGGKFCSGKCIVDGNQTIQGASKTKVSNLKVMSIPKKLTEGWTLSELMLLGSFLNPAEEVPKTPCNDQCFKKLLYTMWESRSDKNLETSKTNINKIINTEENLDIGKSEPYLLKPLTAKNVIKNVVANIEHDHDTSGATWKDYDADAYEHLLDDRVAELEKRGNDMVIHGRTTWFNQAGIAHLSKILLKINATNDIIGQPQNKKIDKLWIILWYKKPIDKKEWKIKTREIKKATKTTAAVHEKKLMHLNKSFDLIEMWNKIPGIEVELEYMPSQ